MTGIPRKRGRAPRGREVLAILVGGGPAPGINGVVSAATIEAIKHGREVVGIMGGINSLFKADRSCAVKLTLDAVSWIEGTGGSVLLTSRGMPQNFRKAMSNLMSTLRFLKVRYLLTIGGEGTLFVAKEIEKASKGGIAVIHVPKSIDNDLPLPAGLPTFGYETARHYGVQTVKNLKEDAKTTRRWYFVKTMGRQTGHLALGIGKAAGASATLIPEEFPQKVSFRKVADILEGTIIKRLAMGKPYGVAVLAEGISGKFDYAELENREHIERDEMGRVSLSRISLSKMMREMVEESLSKKGLHVCITDKDVGYELRAAPPIPFDVEYTRNLGYGAVKYLIHLGGTAGMVIFYSGKLRTIPFAELIEEETGKIKVRCVDPDSETYVVARDYMFRLEREDFDDPKTLQKLARTARLTQAEFRKRFEYTLINEKTRPG